MNNVFIRSFKFIQNSQIHVRNWNKNISNLIVPNKFLSMKNAAKKRISINVFHGDEDRFNGIIVDLESEYCSLDHFPRKLENSLKLWQMNKKRGIWFKISLNLTDRIPTLVKNGFDFHHAKPGFVMLNKWLPAEESRIPVYAHTMLAVGALVMNESGEILTVKEKSYMSSHWKFPGGVVEPGEDIIKAAIREVKEETNIDIEFDSVLAFMHADKGVFGCSDLYIVLAAKAQSLDIKIDEQEILDCRWVALQEYYEDENVTEFNKALVRHFLEYEKHKIKIDYVQGYHKLSKRLYTMYSVNFQDQDE